MRLHFSQPAIAGTLPSYLRTMKLRAVMVVRLVLAYLGASKNRCQRAAYRSTLTLDGDRAIAHDPKVAEACEWPRNVSGLRVRRDSVQAPAYVRGVISTALAPLVYTCYPRWERWGLSRGQQESPVSALPALQNLVTSGDNPEHSLQQTVICWICSRRINSEDCSLDEQDRAVHKSCLEIRDFSM